MEFLKKISNEEIHNILLQYPKKQKVIRSPKSFMFSVCIHLRYNGYFFAWDESIGLYEWTESNVLS